MFLTSFFIVSMNNSNMIWLLIFSLILLGSHWFYSMIIKYINDKPLGKQSVYDVASRDTLRVVQLFGSVYNILAIISRFEIVTGFLSESPVVTLLICSIFSFTFSAACVSVGFICVVRILCLKNITFVEEAIGETLLRILFIFLILGTAIFVTTVQVLTGDVSTGTVYILMTRRTIPVGKWKAIMNIIIYICVVTAFLMQQIYVERIKFLQKKSQSNGVIAIGSENELVLQKSGLLSLLTASTFLVLFVSNLLLAGKRMGGEFYILEYFLSAIVFFFLVPILMILKNENLSQFIRQRLKQYRNWISLTNNQVCPSVTVPENAQVKETCSSA